MGCPGSLLFTDETSGFFNIRPMIPAEPGPEEEFEKFVAPMPINVSSDTFEGERLPASFKTSRVLPVKTSEIRGCKSMLGMDAASGGI